MAAVPPDMRSAGHSRAAMPSNNQVERIKGAVKPGIRHRENVRAIGEDATEPATSSSAACHPSGKKTPTAMPTSVPLNP